MLNTIRKVLVILFFTVFITSCVAVVGCKKTDNEESRESVGSETVSESINESQFVLDSNLFKIKAIDGGCEIVGVKSTDVVDGEGVLNIPHKVNGIDVVCIKSLTNNGELNEEDSFLSQIQQIIIPFSLKEISARAFANLPNLVTVLFEKHSELITIGDGAFENCTSLTSVNLGARVEQVGENCFKNTKISEFFVAEDNPYFKVLDGVLFSYNGVTLIAYPKDKKVEKYIVPTSVTYISKNAFYGNQHLTCVDLKNVMRIGDNAFEDCVNLSNIIGNNVTVAPLSCFINTAWYNNNYDNEFFKLGRVLFKYNGIAETLDLSDYASIGDYAFNQLIGGDFVENTVLKTVKLGVRLSSISEKVFYNCKALTSIYIFNEKQIGISQDFALSINENLKIYVQKALVDRYSAQFENSIVFEPISSTVHFIVDGEETFTETAYWAEIFNTAYKPELKIGSVFSGWFDSLDFNSSFVGNSFFIEDSDVNLYAKFIERDYYIMYEYVIIDGFALGTYAYGDTIVLKTPELAGYVFEGWFWDKDYTQKVESEDLINVYGDLTMYAKWSIDENYSQEECRKVSE